MRIVVINLPEETARRQYIAGQVSRFGLQCDFFEAVLARRGIDGLFDGYDERRFLGSTGRKVTRGEIGCFASHRAVWELCVESDEPVVVLEDDARLAPAFPGALCVAATLIDRCGFIRLQSEHRATSHRLIERDGFSLVGYSKMTQGAAAYVIDPPTAAAFLAQTTVLDAPVDVFIRQKWKHRRHLFGLQPYTVLDSEFTGQSTIGARRKAHDRTLAVRLLRLAVRTAELRNRVLYRPPPDIGRR